MIQLTELNEMSIYISKTQQGIYVTIVLATWHNNKTNYFCLLFFKLGIKFKQPNGSSLDILDNNTTTANKSSPNRYARRISCSVEYNTDV